MPGDEDAAGCFQALRIRFGAFGAFFVILSMDSEVFFVRRVCFIYTCLFFGILPACQAMGANMHNAGVGGR